MKSSTILIAAIVVDLAFFPMLHVGGIPFKPSYLAILGYSAVLLLKSNIGLDIAIRNLILLLFMLALSTLVGYLTFTFLSGSSSYSNTFRLILIFIIGSFCLVVGNLAPISKHNYLVKLAISYSIATILLAVFFEELQFITSFYGLEYQDYFSRRSPGLFLNPNISALFMSLIYMGIIVGWNKGFVDLNIYKLSLIFVFSIATIIILLSRNQIVAMCLMTSTCLIQRLNRRNVLLVSISITLFLLTLFISRHVLDQYSSDLIGYSPLTAVTRGFSSLTDMSHPAKSLKRPLMQYEEASVRAMKAPLFGTGADVSSEEPFKHIGYHNDWLLVWVSSGIIGLITFFLIFYQAFKIELIFAIPFVFPGMTNSLINAPSHFFLFMLIIGITCRSISSRKPVM